MVRVEHEMIKEKRSNGAKGGSVGITFPRNLNIGEFSTYAGERLLVVDVMGELEPDEFANFVLSLNLEQHFKTWKEKRKLA